MRSTTARVGDFVPCSYAESVGCEVPDRRATASCVIPRETRAASRSDRLAMTRPYSFGSDTPRSGTQRPHLSGKGWKEPDMCVADHFGLDDPESPLLAEARTAWRHWCAQDG